MEVYEGEIEFYRCLEWTRKALSRWSLPQVISARGCPRCRPHSRSFRAAASAFVLAWPEDLASDVVNSSDLSLCRAFPRAIFIRSTALTPFLFQLGYFCRVLWSFRPLGSSKGEATASRRRWSFLSWPSYSTILPHKGIQLDCANYSHWMVALCACVCVCFPVFYLEA